MCGILAFLVNNIVGNNDDIKTLLELIDRRGPDYSSPLVDHITDCGQWFKFKSSVLHLRGDTLQEQPVIDEDGNVLLFNGQIYQFSGRPIEKHRSDTIFLSEQLAKCRTPRQIAEAFTEVDGPFAFIYWHHRFSKLFYGRDIFGRKSLCILRSRDSDPIIISSVVDEKLERLGCKWQEVSSDGLHCIDFSQTDHTNERIYLWDLDSIYPRTGKCTNLTNTDSSEPPLEITLLRSLNCDLVQQDEVSDNAREAVMKKFESKFIDAVRSRYKYNRADCLTCRKKGTDVICRDSKVAVAFSGGVDSTLIALALDKIMNAKETIDLVTVAFKDESPDRVSVGSAFLELKQLCPTRAWRLVLCDISKVELQRERNKQIRHLILPCDTVFDDSMGCACWFVSRAEGRAIDSKMDDQWISKHFDKFLKYNPTNVDLDHRVALGYKSPASMMFVGSSIDEQLGGYNSHRRAWSESGPSGLYREISHLMRRISSRNLGRDDRVYCHHGRDLKLPFLDSQFVSYLNELPLALKMNLDEPLDMGPKKILRELALKWGLKETGRRVKRAMQFGTKIAKLERTNENAKDVCSRLRIAVQEPAMIDLTSSQDVSLSERLRPRPKLAISEPIVIDLTD